MSHEAINAIKKIMTIFQASEGVIRPHFIVTGLSGSYFTYESSER